MFMIENEPAVTINKFRLSVRHERDHSRGCPCHYIARMISGEGRFVSAEGEMIVRPGDYFYIPQGLGYRSYWRGDDAIWWDSFGFMLMPRDGGNFGMRKFIPSAEAARLFDEIVSIGEVNCRSVGLVYLLMSEIIPSLSSDADRPDPLVTKATEYMRAHLSEPISKVARFCNVSESGLYAAFRAAGTTPVSVRLEYQLGIAMRLLKTTDLPVDEIAERCSFGSANYLIRLLKKRTGKTTRELRNRNFM